MKKITAILAAALVLTLTACSSTDDNSSENTSSAPQSTANSTSTDSQSASESAADNSAEQSDNSPAHDNNESDSRILIAYFTAAENSGVDAVASASYSMVNGEPVGRLRAIANMIQSETGGDLFSIKTSVVYPTDGGELIDYAAEEQRNDARPELTNHIDDLDKYDTIFVGYPNWCADLPQVMYSFFDEYDFSGKTIIPFNVHNGSRLSGTVGTIAELEPNANVITDAFTISERSVPEAASEVKEWLGGLEY